MALFISMLKPGDLVYVVPVFTDRNHGTGLVLEIERIGFHIAIRVLLYDGSIQMISGAQIWNKEKSLTKDELPAIKQFLQQCGYDHQDGQKL